MVPTLQRGFSEHSTLFKHSFAEINPTGAIHVPGHQFWTSAIPCTHHILDGATSSLASPEVQMSSSKNLAKTPFDRTLTIPLKGWVPTNKNYTVASNTECIICQDYSEIDNFAKMLTLDKLHDLYSSIDPTQSYNTISQYNPNIFDATILYHSLINARDFEPRKEDYNTPIDVLKLFTFKPNPGTVKLSGLFLKYDSILSTFVEYADSRNEDAKQEKIRVKAFRLTDSKLTQAKKAGDTKRAKAYQSTLDDLRAEVQALREKVKFEDDIWKFMLEKAINRVETLARALWGALIKAKLTKGYDPKVDDPVLRARLFFAWLGYSISYDEDLAAQTGRDETIVRFADGLMNGKEICGGYAGLFKVMFDATSPETGQANTSRSLIGRARTYGGPQSQPWESPQLLHAWSAFPVPASAGLQQPLKVIDVTWGASSPPQPLDSVYWSMTNASFLQSHIPANTKKERQKDYAYSMPLEAQRKLGYPNRKSQDLWTQSQPRGFKEGQSMMQWIDRSTIEPNDYTIKATATQNDATVQFQNNCSHQANKAPKFFLMFAEGRSVLDKLQVKDLGKNNASLFVQRADQVDRPIWKATVQIPRGKEGFVVMYTVSKSLVQRVLAWKYDPNAPTAVIPFPKAKL